MTIKSRILTAFCWSALLHCASAADWITAPSYYTHDATGQRVTQHTPIGPFYTYPRGHLTRSGFRYSRSSLQVGTSVDHYHTTEEWGRPIQPYGEWRFPYRPYSVPYDQWGPQPYGFFGYRGYPFGVGPFGGGQFGAGAAGAGIAFPPNGVLPGQVAIPPMLPQPQGNWLQHQPPFNAQQQLLDGTYPPYQELNPFERKQLFDHFYPPRPGQQEPALPR